MKYLYGTLILCLITQNTSAQLITTIAGNGCLGPASGDGIPASTACIGYPATGAFDSIGNYYFGENFGASRIRKISQTGIITTVAGNGTAGGDGDGGQATAAAIRYPAVTVDKAGNIYIADRDNHRVRMVDCSTGIISTIAGNGGGGHTGDGGVATNATLWPVNVATDNNGNVYVIDSTTWIRKIDKSGIISTIAGNGNEGYSGDEGAATLASLYNTHAICTDKSGNLYIGSQGRIRKINIHTNRIETFAGNGIPSPYLGDGIPATNAQFNPYDIAMDSDGNLFIANYGVGNSRILKIDVAGIVHTIAGTGINGYSGDNGPATSAQLYNPEGVAIDACGNVYIADDANRRIRKVTFNPDCKAVAVKDVEKTSSTSLRLYPNPAHTQLTISNTAPITSLCITNVLGQVVAAPPGLPQEEVTVPVEHLPKGVYVVRVNGVYMQRFVKE